MKKAKKEKVVKETVQEITSIDSLDDVPGVGPVGLKKLHEHNILNKLKFLTNLTPTSLIEITGMDRDKADQAFVYVRDVLEKAGKINKGMITASQLHREQQIEKTFQTGSSSIDKLFGNGIKAGYITELYGQNGGGKTQIIISLILDCLIKDPTALVACIDTEGKMLIERFISILKARDLVKTDEEAYTKYIDRMFVFRASSQDEQLVFIDNYSSMLSDGASIKMMVIDSIISLLQAEFQDRGVMKAKFSIIKPMMQNLRRLAETYHIPVIVANTVHKSPTPMFGLDDILPAGGDSVGHISAYRVKLERVGGSGKRRATMRKSPADPENEADFMITSKGVEDAERKK